MSESIPSSGSPKKKWWLYIATFLVLGVAIHLLLPQISMIEKSLGVLKNMTWWLVALAISAQVLSYAGSGYILKAIVATRQQYFSIWRGALITLASYSVGFVAGGWIGGIAATYGWMSKDKTNSDSAAVVSILPALLNDAALTAVSIIGMVYLFIVHDLKKSQIFYYGLVLVLLSALVLITVMAVKRPGIVKKPAVWLGAKWAKIRHQEYQPEETIASVDRIMDAWKSLDKGRWVKPTLGAFANVGFDMLTLYLVFLAAGYRLSLGVLFAGYSLPLMLGKIAFILPGGIGLIETSMAVLFVSLKAPSDVAVISILGYRLLSFWLPTLFGFLAAIYLGRQEPAKPSDKDFSPKSG